MDMKNVKAISVPNPANHLYKILDHIHFSGNEYIAQTPTIFFNKFKITMEVANIISDIPSGQGTSKAYPLITCQTGTAEFTYKINGTVIQNINNKKRYGIGCVMTTNYNYEWLYSEPGSIYTDPIPKTKYAINLYTGQIYVNDNLLTTGSFYVPTTLDETHGFCIGALINQYNTVTTQNSVFDLYSLKITSGDPNETMATMDFIPVQRISDNVCGLYVSTTKQFIPMQGTEITINAAGTWNGLYIDEIATVKKIQDSNGNVIWGSYDAFPYRRLEYIHFNGNDYINTGYTPYNNFGFYVDIKWDQGAVGQYNGHGKVTSNNRCYIGSETGGKVAYGSGSTASNISNSNTFERHKYQVNTSSTTNGKFYIDGVQVWSGTSSYQESNRGTMYIGAVYRNSSDYSYCKANIYNVRFINNVSNSSTITWNLIPCQRKSDGAIGFLKLNASGATPDFMTSVNGLLEAGPVVDEYWDMTNPF